MSAEYSVGGILAVAEAADNGDVRHPGMVADMLRAFASCIEADERAVPVAWMNSQTECVYETREEVPLTDGDEYAVPLFTHHAEIAEAVKSKTCAWTQDEFDGSWDTACGNKHQFTDGSPADNEHAFCPYCGGKLEVGDAAMHNSAREDGE